MASTVLITGASQGVGKATALLFGRSGYNVILAARQSDRLTATAAEVQATGGQTLAISTDVREPQQVEHLVQAGLSHFGSIDVLVNNAGIYTSGPAEEFSLEDWHQTIDTNLWGYIHTIHHLLPHFLQRGTGTIVNLISIGGKVPIPYLAPYTTAKFALTGLTEALHTELNPKGIQVCGIYPNILKTNFLERAIFRGKSEADQQARRQQVEQVLQFPLVETPEDVAKVVWQTVKHPRAEVLVGSAKLSVISSNVMPRVMQWVMRQTFKNQDSYQPR